MPALQSAKLRRSEWILIAFFAYVCAISPFFPNRPHLKAQPEVALLIVSAIVWGLAIAERGKRSALISHLRDWLPIGLTLVAFRDMEWFLPQHFDHNLENTWIRWDRALLHDWHVRSAIERLGFVGPGYLELCYLLVYGVAAYCVWTLYKRHHRDRVDAFWVVYLTGTLLAYALFPFFPSQPPRYVFPGLDLPAATGWARRLNLLILQKATIHVGVFPSAHVSSVFSAAWAMFALESRARFIGTIFVVYAASVSVATVYGRYHYAADVAAGFAVSFIAGAVAWTYRTGPKARSTAGMRSAH